VKGYNHEPANVKKLSMRNQARAAVEKDLGAAAIASIRRASALCEAVNASSRSLARFPN
jgi:hypothetical protein